MKIDLNTETPQSVSFAQMQAHDQLTFLNYYSDTYLWTNLISATLLGAISWALNPQDIFIVGIWYVSLMAMNAVRWMLDLEFKPSRHYTLHQLEKMLQQQLIYSTAISTLWGTSGFLLFSGDISVQAIHVLLLAMIVVSSLPILALARNFLYLQITVLLVPIILSLSFCGQFTQNILAFVVLMFGVMAGFISFVFEHLFERLQNTQIQLLEQTNRDPLTKLPNRRYFEQIYKAEWQRAARSGSPIALLLVDIDRFKQYNDLQGHYHGDVAIKSIVQILQQIARRTSDVVVRHGGDKFIVLLPNTSLDDATRLAERMRATVEALQLEFSPGEFERYVTVSIGVSFCNPTPVRENEPSKPKDLIYPAVLLNAVDRALYRAKRDGRNQVVKEKCSDEAISRAEQHMDNLRAAASNPTSTNTAAAKVA